MLKLTQIEISRVAGPQFYRTLWKMWSFALGCNISAFKGLACRAISASAELVVECHMMGMAVCILFLSECASSDSVVYVVREDMIACSMLDSVGGNSLLTAAATHLNDIRSHSAPTAALISSYRYTVLLTCSLLTCVIIAVIPIQSESAVWGFFLTGSAATRNITAPGVARCGACMVAPRGAGSDVNKP